LVPVVVVQVEVPQTRLLPWVMSWKAQFEPVAGGVEELQFVVFCAAARE
jgi:hypothetical protein